MDGAGKTTFADELAAELLREGRTVVRISVDGFHRPRDERYRRGRHSPEGFWADSYDYDALRTQRPGAVRARRVPPVPPGRPRRRHRRGARPPARARHGQHGARRRRDLPAPRRAGRLVGLLGVPRRRLRRDVRPHGRPRRLLAGPDPPRERPLRRGPAPLPVDLPPGVARHGRHRQPRSWPARRSSPTPDARVRRREARPARPPPRDVRTSGRPTLERVAATARSALRRVRTRTSADVGAAATCCVRTPGVPRPLRVRTSRCQPWVDRLSAST